MIWLYLIKFIIFFIITLSWFITFLINPIHSAFCLIFIFLLTSLLFLLLNIKFLGFVILILYAGAISILFLFITFTMNIRYSEILKKKIIEQQVFVYIALLKLSIFIFFYQESLIPKKTFENLKWLNKLDTMWNVDIGLDSFLIGRYLFSDKYYFYFLVVGLILFFAMITVVLITKQFLKNN